MGLFGRPSSHCAPPPLHNHSYISYGRSRMLVFPSGSLLLRWICPLLDDEPLQFPLPDKGFNLLLQVVAVSYVMAVITVEATVLIPRPFIKISLQLAEKDHGSFILNLHQNLVDQGSQ